MSAVFPKMGASSQSSGQDTNFKQDLLVFELCSNPCVLNKLSTTSGLTYRNVKRVQVS